MYEQKKMLFRFLIGLAIIFAGVFITLPTWARAILLLIGAWFIASLDFPSQLRADRTLEARKGVLSIDLTDLILMYRDRKKK